ncbi:hypothetical protein QTP70_019696 [Hemibagrus guttatus]|uniref:Integrase zinc-binding domain-containing protein n=1 Tax=Hemibagrus guttatus TaxID=175788 RepID=A0AAE0UTU8_9TELE|nr:hypothetical protein QTP70_019696 [Hemibagrus guttatus]
MSFKDCWKIRDWSAGSKNTKPDALSRQFTPSLELSTIETVFPSQCLVAAIVLDIEEKDREALVLSMYPLIACSYLLSCPEVLEWGHNSKLSCHPGGACTLYLIQQRFWWANMNEDVPQFVAACDNCIRNKSPNLPPRRPPQTSSCPPQSHIALDFITGLLVSEGNSCIMTVVDRFSKATHFVPLTQLPFAR